ncbi:hypothetical protein [Micromonospora sp. NPDC092111]|uniref:hypothetical protein n=1 Tax=Micromonospora sp. NPDC092111 TaxID=3364289 RepID=UPI0037FF6883
MTRSGPDQPGERLSSSTIHPAAPESRPLPDSATHDMKVPFASCEPKSRITASTAVIHTARKVKAPPQERPTHDKEPTAHNTTMPPANRRPTTVSNQANSGVVIAPASQAPDPGKGETAHRMKRGHRQRNDTRTASEASAPPFKKSFLAHFTSKGRVWGKLARISESAGRCAVSADDQSM